MAEPLQRIAFSAPNDLTIFGAGWKYVGDCIFVPQAFGFFARPFQGPENGSP